MKKTKKQKLLADLRRKIASVEKQIEKPTGMLLDALPEKKEAPNSITVSYAPIVKAAPFYNKSLTIDYTQIAKDLKKTLLFSGIILSTLTILKLILK